MLEQRYTNVIQMVCACCARVDYWSPVEHENIKAWASSSLTSQVKSNVCFLSPTWRNTENNSESIPQNIQYNTY